jgi:hypothetical protein
MNTNVDGGFYGAKSLNREPRQHRHGSGRLTEVLYSTMSENGYLLLSRYTTAREVLEYTGRCGKVRRVHAPTLHSSQVPILL